MSPLYSKTLVLTLLFSVCSIEALSTNSSQYFQASFYGATHPLHTSTPSLHVYLAFTATHGTLLTATSDQGPSLQLSLTNHSLNALLPDSHSPVEVSLLLDSITPSQWLQLELTLADNSLALSLQNSATTGASLPSSFNFTGDLHLGGDPFANTTLDNFVGCISNVTLDSQDVDFSPTPTRGYNSGCCIPPRRAPSRGLGVVNNSLWESISIVAHEAMVDHGDTVIIFDENLVLTIPNDLVSYDVGYWHRGDVINSIILDVIEQPNSGYFALGTSRNEISSFYYSDLLSMDSASQIVFHHNGNIGTADSALLRARFECQDNGLSPWSQNITFPISIVQVNKKPYIRRQNTLIVAVGTRRSITSDIITVTDEETPSNISYTVESVNCASCVSSPGGVVVNAAGHPIKYFSQSDINQKKVIFQHSALSDPDAVMTIHLRVQDDVIYNTIYPRITVQPRPGNILFTPTEKACMFLEVGHTFVLSPGYLNVTTDFENQDPEIAYDVIRAPSDGRLEVFDANRWFLFNETLASRRLKSPHVIGYFTQRDVDLGNVRFVHTGEIGGLHDLTFHLRSFLLVQPTEHKVCFHTVNDFELLQPEFLLDLNTAFVAEGSSVPLNSDIISASLSEQDFIYDPGNENFGVNIKIEQLEPVFVLESVPSVGQIRMSTGELVLSGGNFSLEEIRSGSVYYHNNGDEVFRDSFSVRMIATVGVALIKQPNPSELGTVLINIAPINDHAPTVRLNDISVTEGSFVVVTRNHILVEDSDLSLSNDGTLQGDEITISFRRPRSNRPADLPLGYGYFAFRDTDDEPIIKCLMENITNHQVVFIHQLDPNFELSYNQALKITDGEHILKPWPTFRVNAIPHNLTVVEPDIPSTNCRVSIDLNSVRNHTLDISGYQFTMRDSHGEDANLVHLVNVTLKNPLQYGRLVMVVNGVVQEAPYFSVSDLEMRRIHYQYTSEELHSMKTETLEFNLMYGHTLADPLQIPICIDPIPKPDHIRVLPATVSSKGLSMLNSSSLWSNDTRGHSGADIRYEIINFPTLGDIVNSSQSSPKLINSFTQADIDQNFIGYLRPYTSGRQSDSFTFRVCSRADICSEEKELSLVVRFVNLTIVNPGITVEEGENHTFNITHFRVTAPENYGQVRFLLKIPPSFGQLINRLPFGSKTLREEDYFDMEVIQFRQLTYQNDGEEETLFDSFTVEIYTVNSQNLNDVLTVIETVQITVLPVNDNVPAIINLPENRLTVYKYGSFQITSSILSAVDEDSDVNDTELIWRTLSNTPWFGYLYLDSDPGIKELGTKTWTEQDIRDGRLFLKGDPSKSDDILLLRVDETVELSLEAKDRGPQNTEYIQLSYVDIIFTISPDLVPFSIVEGDTAKINGSYLYYTANAHNLEDSEILYTVISSPTNGKLLLNEIELELGEKFSQQKVLDGELLYVHDHSNTLRDFFNFKLADSENRESDEIFTFDIDVVLRDDDPPEVVINDPVLLVLRTEVIINEKVIMITDKDTLQEGGLSTDDDMIVCTIVQPTKWGLLQKNRFQAGWTEAKYFTKYDLEEQTVRYNSTLFGGLNDSFTFTIADMYNQANTTYTVNIYILPETVDLTVSSLAIEEDHQAPLEELHFVVNHFYLSQVPGTFIVTRSPTKGYLMDTVTGYTNVSNFTTAQLEAESVMYVHGGDEDQFDEFEFYYQSDTMQGISRESNLYEFEIIITPNNDQAPMLNTTRSTTLELWAGDKVPLTQEYLNAYDGDTTSKDLRYIVHEHTTDAYIAYANNTAKSISVFSQEDVNEERVVFVHRQDPDGEIYYNVTDGEFVITGEFDFKSDPLMLFCQLPPWVPLFVPRLGTVTLSLDNVNCNTNDLERREIRYHIRNEVKFGEFLVNGVQVMMFTNTQLEKGQVSYRHLDEDRWENTELVTLVIESDLGASDNQVLNITIDLPVVEGRPAINTGITVVEGDFVCLNLTSLDARNVRYDAWRSAGPNRPNLFDMDIRFKLDQMPAHGTILINERSISPRELVFTHSNLASGSVCYHHDDSETLSDTITYTLTVVGPGGFVREYNVQDTFEFTVQTVNDVSPILVTSDPSLKLVMGFTFTLTSAFLEITDEDSVPSSIRIFIGSLPNNSQIMFRGKVLNVNEQFTQADVNNGLISLRGISLGQSSFEFYFTDMDGQLFEPTPHLFTVTVVEHTLSILGTKRVTYPQNEVRVKITTDFLSSYTNGDNSATVYRIVSQPSDGLLKRRTGSEVMQNVEEFTQEDLDEERLWYIANDKSKKHSDEFAVTVRNEELEISEEKIAVHVLIWGNVRKDTTISFADASEGDELSVRLPSDIIITLFRPSVLEPILQIEPPKYGHLELNFQKRKRSIVEGEEATFSFHYDDLKSGWVYYVWDCDEPVSDSNIRDNFTLLVEGPGLKPGEAFVELNIVPPPISTTPPPITVSVVSEQFVSTDVAPQPKSDAGFPLFTLIPIIGVVLLLLIVIAIVIGFCLTQQKKIRKKLHPNIASTNRAGHEYRGSPSVSPTRFSPSISPTRQMNQFHFEADSDEGDHRSLSSGFSEDGEVPPLRSPLRSPTHSHAFSYSPPYPLPSPTYTAHRPLPQLAPRSRVLSNVSITLSGRMSEMSLEEPNRAYSHSLPRPSPLNVAVPIPVRPSSQVAHRAMGNGESGYNTCNHTNENSRHHSRSSVVYEEGDELTTDGEFPSALDDHMTTTKDDVPTIQVVEKKTEIDEEGGVHKLLDLNDPNVQRLFRSNRPVLKKQEYWF